jgi:hypothetical protein
MISPSLTGSYAGGVRLAVSGSLTVTAPAIELPNSRSIAYRSVGLLMPRRWVSCSRWRPSCAYPPKKLLAALGGAFSRTDPNDSVSVTGPGVYPSPHSNSMRSRRDPRVIHPICAPCRRTSSLSAIRAAIPGGRVTSIECHA